MKIAISGATGFVGRPLIAKLLETIPGVEIIALSRSSKGAASGHVESRTCDLFSLLQAEAALKDADVAIYLVHSMQAKSHLSQGSFVDFDLILADNFARAAKKAGVKQIIYLGGIIPIEGDLSEHLQSRLEVEEALSAQGVPVTILRAGLIVGPLGSSFNIVSRLVDRLPLMICPAWMLTETQPIDLEDVLASIVHVIGRPKALGQTYDIAGPERLSYLDVMRETAEVSGLKRFFIPVRWFSTGFSKLWVALFSGAPFALVSPLIESLRHKMVPRPGHQLILPGRVYRTYRDAAQKAVQKTANEKPEAPHAFSSVQTSTKHTARSVQRMPLPSNWHAKDVAREYMTWLPRFFRPLLKVVVSGANCDFFLLGWKRPLLSLEQSALRSSSGRELFYVRGGLLAKGKGFGRLEFREAHHSKFVMAALHDFQPSLPWRFYIWTQALVHLYVMHSFRRHLAKLSRVI